MNIPAKLSLASVPVLLLVMWYASTLEPALFSTEFWIFRIFVMIIIMLLLFAPMVGIFLALFAKKPIQIISLILLNISYYPIMWWLYDVL
jgi:hypothetical protein